MKKMELLEALIEAMEVTLTSLDQHGFTVDDVKNELEDAQPQDAARAMAKFQCANEQAEALKSLIGKIYDWSRMSLVPNSFEAAGVDMLRVEGVGRVSLTGDINLSVLDKDKQYLWLEEIGSADIITETVNASTLKALIRRRLKAGEEVPEDIFKVKPITRASITKS